MSHFFLLKRKMKEEWRNTLTQTIPFYLPRVIEPRLEMLGVGRATTISSSVFYYSWIAPSCSLHRTYRAGNKSGFDILLGQMTLLRANNILGWEVDLKAISPLPSSHSLRICWAHLFTQSLLIKEHQMPRILPEAGGILMIMVGALKPWEGSQYSPKGCIIPNWAKTQSSKSVNPPQTAVSAKTSMSKWHKNRAESSGVKLGVTYPWLL